MKHIAAVCPQQVCQPLPLISLLEDYSMVMLLLKGIPMLQSKITKNWTRVDNVFATHNIENYGSSATLTPDNGGQALTMCQYL